MEEKNKKKFPSLPSNYVTLLQLQQRRLKEQEERQKEKEEEEEEQRRKLLEEQRLKEEQRMRRQQEDEEKKLHETPKAQATTEAKASHSERKRRIQKEIDPEMQKEGGGGGCVAAGIAAENGGISDERQKPKDSKHKKKHWMNKGKKKTMTRKTEEESEAGVLKQLQAEKGDEGNQIPVDPKEGNKTVWKKKWEPKVKEEEEAPTGIVEEKEPKKGHGESNKIDCGEKPERRRRRVLGTKGQAADEKAARASGLNKDKDIITVTVVEIARELEDLAVADHHEEENHGGSKAVRANCGGPKSGRGRSRSRGRSGRNIRDGGLMWVKKGETSEYDGSRILKAKAKSKPRVCVS